MASIKCRLCGCERIQLYLHAYDVRVVMDGTRYSVYRCEVCGGKFLDDQNVREGIDYYGNQYYSLTALTSDQMEQIKGTVKPAAHSMRVLDVGCGTGAWLYLKRLEGHEAWGVDIEPRAVSAAREIGLQVVQHLDELPGMQYDLIHLSHLLEHVPSPVKMLAALKEKLAPAGQIEIIVPNGESGKIELEPQSSCYLDVPRHLTFFSAKSLGFVIEKAGLRIVELDWRALPMSMKEVLGDCRRLFRYRSQSHASLTEISHLFWEIFHVRMHPSLMRGSRADWLYAQAVLPK